MSFAASPLALFPWLWLLDISTWLSCIWSHSCKAPSLSSSVAALPHVVSEAHFAQATGINSAADEAGVVVGPGLGGFIIGLSCTTIVGAALAYLEDSLSYLVSVISLGLIRPPFPRDAQRVCSRRSNWRESVLHGSHVCKRQESRSSRHGL